MVALEEIIELFNVPKKAYSIEVHNQGLINATYMVKQDQKICYVLQRINTEVFKNVEALTSNISYVLPYLKSRDYLEIEYVNTRKGQKFLSHKSGVWRLMHFIDNSRVMNTSESIDVAFEVGQVIRRFHELTSRIDTHKLKEVIPDFHLLDLRLEQYHDALHRGDIDRIRRAAATIQFIEKTIKFVQAVDPKTLPQRTCHNDTKLNNVLFSADGKALCLIDLDTIMKGSVLFDLGDALRTLCNPAEETEKDLNKINFSLEMFQGFIQGFFQTEGLLTEDEVRAISWSVVYMPFLHGMRALTDYLLGDLYYAVQYKEQNLDRSRSLLKFADLALKNQEQMNEILLPYLRNRAEKSSL